MFFNLLVVCCCCCCFGGCGVVGGAGWWGVGGGGVVVVIVFIPLPFLCICPFTCSNTRATSRFITLLKPKIYLFKSSLSFSGASLWNAIPTKIKSCNSLTSFKTQLHKWFRSRFIAKKQKQKSISSFVMCIYIHACIVSQCYYELIYYSFVLFIIIT